MDTEKYGWLSLLPPILAILLALLTRKVILSLCAAIIAGSILVWVQGNGHSYFFGLDHALDTYFFNAASDNDHVSIILFSLIIAAMVHIAVKNNSLSAFFIRIGALVKTRRGALLTTYFAGLFVFFDDYANSLIVGQSLKGLTDRFKISRAKLAYLVDSTAAPIAAIALVSTWVGAEVDYINKALKGTSNKLFLSAGMKAYDVFLASLPYSFYPILTLIFVGIVSVSGRDFGPMRKSEMKIHVAETKEKNSGGNLWLGVVPILVLIISTLCLLVYTGARKLHVNIELSPRKLSDIIGASDAYKSLLLGSGAALFSSILLNITVARERWGRLLKWMFDGVKQMLEAILVLVLAWALANVIKDIGTADYISGFIKSSNLSMEWVPLFTFIISGVVSFSIGSSWSTMSIMYPLVIPVMLKFLVPEVEYEAWNQLFLCSVASVLGGAVFGDHCSPISDTTLLSSMASGCNHIEHVKTQMPYALLVGGTTVIAGILPICLHWGIVVSYAIALATMLSIFFVLSKNVRT